MLVLSRKLGEKILIGDNITITVVDIDRGKIRLGIDAPRDVLVYREEVLPPPGFTPSNHTMRPAPQQHVPTQEERTVRAARMAGYDGDSCPHCAELKVVSSGNQCACDACGKRWEKATA